MLVKLRCIVRQREQLCLQRALFVLCACTMTSKRFGVSSVERFHLGSSSSYRLRILHSIPGTHAFDRSSQFLAQLITRRKFALYERIVLAPQRLELSAVLARYVRKRLMLRLRKISFEFAHRRFEFFLHFGRADSAHREHLIRSVLECANLRFQLRPLLEVVLTHTGARCHCNALVRRKT